jgi:CBS domain-containing protein
LIVAIGENCSREVIFTGRDTTAKRAAQLMREHHVGSIVVVDETNGRRVPAGIVTDRDIVVAVLALGLNADAIQVGDVMNRELLAVNENAGVAETIEFMRVKGVRRVPVTDAGGALVGIVAADDLLSLLAEEMSALSTMVSREHRREVEVRKMML